VGVGDIEQVIRAVFSADDRALDRSLRRLDDKATEVDRKLASVGRNIGRESVGRVEAEIAELARIEGELKTSTRKQDSLSLDQAREIVERTRLQADAAEEAVKDLDKLSEAIESGGKATKGLKSEFLDFAKTADNRILSVIRGFNKFVEIVAIGAAAIGGVVAAIITLNRELERIAWANFNRDFTATANAVAGLERRLLSAAEAAERLRDALKGAAVRDLGAKESAARDRGDFASAGIFGMQRLQMEGKNEADRFRQLAGEARKTAAETMSARGVLELERAQAQSKLGWLELGRKPGGRLTSEESARVQAAGGWDRVLQEQLGIGRGQWGHMAKDVEALITGQLARTQVALDAMGPQISRAEELIRDASKFEETARSVEDAASAAASRLMAGDVERLWNTSDLKEALRDVRRPRGGGDINVDARNARVQVRQDIQTNDPGQLAGATLAGAFRGLVQQTLTSSVLNPLVGR